MEGQEKEVRFDLYCKTCEHANEGESYDVCNDCLYNPSRIDSHKPLRYKEK